jgi:hypothetical protein
LYLLFPTRDNCEKIFCELFITTALAFVSLIKKDEARTGSVDDPLDNLHIEALESVPVGHHNLVDHSFLDSFQNPLVRCDVCASRVGFLHGLDLVLVFFCLVEETRQYVVPLIVSLVMVVGCVSGVWYLYLHHQTF